MKTHTNDFKTNVKEFGRELDSIISYTIDNVDYELGAEELNSISPHYEGAILKSVMKQLDIDSNVEIPIGTVVNYQFGVKTRQDDVENYRDNYDYINFGNYVVKEVEKQEDTRSYKITCFDKLLYSMVDYETPKINNTEITYPITIRDYINAICVHLGITFKNANGVFANYDKEIQNELFLDEKGNSLGYMFRDVLDELAQVTASTICINEEDDELEIRYITNTNDTIDEEYLKDINVNFREKYGAINTIVLSRSAEADNIYYPETLPEDPFEIKITDNQIMNFNDRDTYLPDIYDKLNGLEYYLNNFSSGGITYYNLCDRYNVQIGNNNYSCVMLNDEINITQGLEENTYTEMPKETETNYKKADKTDRRINQAYLIVDKQNQIIESVISTSSEQEEKISKLEQNIDGFIFSLENKGIANVLYGTSFQTGFYKWGKSFENENSEIKNSKGFEITDDNETVSGKSLISENKSSPFESYLCSDFNKVISNTEYTFNCKYNDVGTIYIYEFAEESDEIILNNATNKIEINNGEELPYTFTTLETTEYIVILFENLTTSGKMVIADIMLNLGNTSIEWSQNRNEFYNGKVSINENGITTYINEENYSNMDGLDFNQVINNETTFSTANGKVYSKNLEWEETFKKGGKFLTRVLDDGIADFWIGGE